MIHEAAGRRLGRIGLVLTDLRFLACHMEQLSFDTRTTAEVASVH